MQIDEWKVGLWRMTAGFVPNDSWICGEWKVDL